MAPICAQTIANCGAYVVIIDRGIWLNEIDTWSAEVMLVYHHLLEDKSMSIDSGRVYLFARSGENGALSGMLATNSAPWRGMIALIH